jgi:hypothetical protein
LHIYIDESGTFNTREDGSSVGVLGALVITEGQLQDFKRSYVQLRPLLPKDKGEVKGRLLGESDVKRVVRCALRAGLIYEATVIDLLPEHSAAVEAHRTGQCEGLTRSLTPQHQPSMIEGVWGIRRQLESMPLQLYVQAVGILDLMWCTLENATMYYSLREPQALAQFHWVVDAKDPSGKTLSEEWWSKVLMPMTQARSLREPFQQFDFGDYSHMATEEMPIPDYLVKELPDLRGKTGIKMNNAFKDITFSADALPGLEVVDVLTNALRRAVMGRLAQAGWQDIGGTMIHRKRPTYVKMVGFGQDERVVRPDVAKVLRQLSKVGRPMLREEDG